MIRWCFTHKVGWYYHERDETCRDYDHDEADTMPGGRVT